MIIKARRREGDYLVHNPGKLPVDVPFILAQFGNLSRRDTGREPTEV